MKMSEKTPELDPRLKSRLEELKPDSPRDPRRAAQTRAKFLVQVEAAQPVKRVSFWSIPVRALVPAFLFLILLVASTGTVFAARESLPGEALYPVKLFGEEIRLSWTTDPEQRVNLLLEYSAARVEEISSLAVAGRPIPQPVLDRLEGQFTEAASLAASLEDDQLVSLMARVELQLQNEEQALAQAQEQAGTGPGNQTITRVREQVQVQITLAQMGQQDPQRFRHTVRGWQESPTAFPTATLTPGQPTVAPSATPTNPGFGPGGSGTPGPHGTQEPGNGDDNSNGNGNGNDNGNGNGNDNGSGGSATPQGPGGGGGPNPSVTPQPNTPGPKKTPTGGGGGGKP
jgi:hypothetical protein